MNTADSKNILQHYDFLDGWRGLAIIFLLIGHFFPVPGINFGTLGVNLFFVLSGYLMGQLLFIKETPIKAFYRRRISRIFPAHIFFIISVTAFFIATQKPINWAEVFYSLIFVNNYLPGELGNPVMPFGHIWSLSVEEHSYVILSIIAIACRSKRFDAKWIIIGITLLFTITSFWNYYNYSGTDLYKRDLHTEVRAYGIFVSVAFLLLLHKNNISTPPLTVYTLLIITGILMHWWSIPNHIGRAIGVACLALAVNLLFCAPKIIKNFLSLRPLKIIGLWSFSIYLWQQPFYFSVHKNGMPQSLGILFSLVCGIASFYLLENPIRAYLNKVWGKYDDPITHRSHNL